MTLKDDLDIDILHLIMCSSMRYINYECQILSSCYQKKLKVTANVKVWWSILKVFDLNGWPLTLTYHHLKVFSCPRYTCMSFTRADLINVGYFWTKPYFSYCFTLLHWFIQVCLVYCWMIIARQTKHTEIGMGNVMLLQFFFLVSGCITSKQVRRTGKK